jgi:hypothetical protein
MSCKNETSSPGYGTYYSNALPANTSVTDINKTHAVNTHPHGMNVILESLVLLLEVPLFLVMPLLYDIHLILKIILQFVIGILPNGKISHKILMCAKIMQHNVGYTDSAATTEEKLDILYLFHNLYELFTWLWSSWT